MILPVFQFNIDSHRFDVQTYTDELQLPPLAKDTNNRDIPFEEILTNQYKRQARANSFKTDKQRLIFWLRALQLRYWKQLGEDPNYVVNWNDRRKNELENQRDEIIIDLDSIDPLTNDNIRLFTITTHLGTGTITIQGVHHSYFGSKEFPVLKTFVDDCVKNCRKAESSDENTIPKEAYDSCYDDATENELNTENTPQNADIFAEINDITVTDQTFLKINTQEINQSQISSSEMSQTSGKRIVRDKPITLDFEDTGEPSKCLDESTPKIKTKKNPDKEIKKLWEKLENQEKFNERFMNLATNLQTQLCEMSVFVKLQSESKTDSQSDKSKVMESTLTEKDHIISELKLNIKEKNNIINDLKMQLSERNDEISKMSKECSSLNSQLAKEKVTLNRQSLQINDLKLNENKLKQEIENLNNSKNKKSTRE